MKQKTLQEQYNLLKEGKGNAEIFMKSAKQQFPTLIRNAATLSETVSSLKHNHIISENIWGVTTGRTETPDWFKIFNENMQTIAEEAKAVEKKPTKEVVDMETAGYDYKDKDNIDNLNGAQFLKGFYAEMKDPKNAAKTVEELREMVAKNLAKDELYYVKDGQFGVKGVGYTTEHPGLGTPKEAKGKYKSSGYGDLKESKINKGSGMSLEDAEKEAQRISKKEGVTQHVNKVKDGYKVSDWFDNKSTVASYENGRQLNESENITEEVNYDKWRRAFNGKVFANKVVLVEDGMGNEKRYIIFFKYDETPKADTVSLSERHIGGHEGGGTPFALSNMQNKPERLFGPDAKTYFTSDEEFEKFLQEGSKGLENMLSFYLEGENADNSIRKWFNTGVQRVVKILPAKYSDSAAVNEVKKDQTVYGDGRQLDEGKKIKKETPDSKLSEIEKQGKIVTLEAQLDALDEIIEAKNQRITMISEDENLSELVDKAKINELQKEIKLLEKRKATMEKMYEKMTGKSYTKKEIVDEDGDKNQDGDGVTPPSGVSQDSIDMAMSQAGMK